MLKENSVFRQEALVALDGCWIMAALTTFVYMAISGGASSVPAIGLIIAILVVPIQYGYEALILKRFRGEELNIGALFDGFQDYGRILGTVLLQGIYTFLWMLLLVVPGVVKYYSYSMTCFILLDHPELKYDAAIVKSMAMMDGHKMKLFLLDLSFIGWAILSLFTFGIGMFWLAPYITSAHAAFYENLKNEVQVVA